MVVKQGEECGPFLVLGPCIQPSPPSKPGLLCLRWFAAASFRALIHTLHPAGERQWLGTYLCDVCVRIICSPSFENRRLLCSLFYPSWSISFLMKADPRLQPVEFFCSTFRWFSRIDPSNDQLFTPNHFAWLLRDSSCLCSVPISAGMSYLLVGSVISLRKI